MKKKTEEKSSNNNKSEKGKELKASTEKLEARINGIMSFILRYNDYIVVILSIELFIVNMLAVPLSSVKWNSNEKPPSYISLEFVDLCLYFYANLLFIK
jgi:hypothetical protein|tara:strand:- start:857 stop:1153 length:297 start_codon:yes stop_codon:yes gene_type:complete